MDVPVQQLIANLHAADLRLALVMTGGGATAAGWLLGVPGGSRTILEISIPYGETALTNYLGRCPDSFCSPDTSRALARRAYDRAGWFTPGRPVAGVAVTASLRSDRPKRGDHRVHITVQTVQRCTTLSLTFLKDARDRRGEEGLVDRILLNVLAEAAGIPDRVETLLLPGEEVHREDA